MAGDYKVRIITQLVDDEGNVVSEETATSEESVPKLVYDDLGDLDVFLDKFDKLERATLKTSRQAMKNIADGYSQSAGKKRK